MCVCTCVLKGRDWGEVVVLVACSAWQHLKLYGKENHFRVQSSARRTLPSSSSPVASCLHSCHYMHLMAAATTFMTSHSFLLHSQLHTCIHDPIPFVPDSAVSTQQPHTSPACIPVRCQHVTPYPTPLHPPGPAAAQSPQHPQRSALSVRRQSPHQDGLPAQPQPRASLATSTHACMRASADTHW